MRKIVLALSLALPVFAAVPGTPVIIDTDMGTDDVMAIALILSHREIQVEAITVVSGLAHVAAGAANARRLVQASGRTGIAVYEGRETPMQRTAGFPEEWRKSADRPISPATIPKTETERAEIWLGRRLKDGAHPVRILALGPLTNLALAIAGANPKAVEEIVMMGGAFRVAGNLGDEAILKGKTPAAEANFFADPEAAARVFRSRLPLRVVPLDATNQVKMDRAFVAHFKESGKGALAEIVGHVLDDAHESIESGMQYAWDALAAAALLDSSVAVWIQARVSIRVSGADAGRSVIGTGPPNAKLALGASRTNFDRIFLGAFDPDGQPMQYVCQRAQGIVVDGKLDDAAWRDAPWTDLFVDIEGAVKPAPRFPTRVKMLWDDTYLYIGAELSEPDVWATLTQHDSVIFHDNDFEVFLNPSGDSLNYFEFEINALNTSWDLFLPKPYRQQGKADNSWEIPGLKSAVYVDGTLNHPGDKDRGWSVEIAFPWSAFRERSGFGRPKDGDEWRVNFSRVEWRIDADYKKIAGREDNWVWSPQGVVDMHRPEKWGFVQFVGGHR